MEYPIPSNSSMVYKNDLNPKKSTNIHCTFSIFRSPLFIVYFYF